MRKVAMMALGPVLAAAAIMTPGSAQTMMPELDYATAATIRDTCIAWASERDLKVSIAVFNRHGNLITSAHMDGAEAAVAEIAQWKGRSAARMQISSGVTANWGGSAPGVADWRGGVPFATKDGAPLGGAGASGASSEDDEQCLVAGIIAAGVVPVGME